MPKHYARIDGLTAPEANQVILLRRSPSRQTQLFIWDFNTDEIVVGDRVKAKPYTRRSDVTLDGNYMVSFFMGNPRALPDLPQNTHPTRFEDTFTVLSVPPSLTPEALWLSEDTYGGGGYWRDNQTLILNSAYERTVMAPPAQIAVLLEQIGNPDLTVLANKLLSRGWTEVPKPIEIPRPPKEKKRIPNYEEALAIGERDYNVNRAVGQNYKSFQKSFAGGEITLHLSWEEEWCTVHDNQRAIGLELHSYNNHPLWIDVDGSDRLVYADKGCLYAWSNFPESQPTLIADLNPNTFENIPPPDWALKP